jgi:ParB/RepB/Spo0J family partition protein
MSTKEFASDIGAAIAKATPADEDQFAMLDLDVVVASLTNPRRHFNQIKLAELAENIKATGVHHPVLVRPLPAARLQETFNDRRRGAALPSHEIVAGERRFRASKLAGVATIPAMMRRLTDDQVREIQLTENLLREDLTALEEAEGFHQLMEHSHLSAEEVGVRVKRSKAHVYARVKLRELTQEAREALETGKIDASIALPIARIPDAKLQKKALTEALKRDGNDEPLYSVRSFETWVRANVMLDLAKASFNIKDETLHATAGSCKECPKRTGANPDLFADVRGADICTDPRCFEAKAEVHRGRLVAKAEAKGYTVIEGKAAKEIVSQYGYQPLKGYSRLDQKRTDIDESGPSLRKLLGNDAPSPVLIEDPYTKELIEAVPTAEAEAVLIAKGAIAKEQSQTAAQLEVKIDRLKDEAKIDGMKAGRRAMFDVIKEAVRTEADDAVSALITADLVRTWLVRQIVDFDAGETLVEVLNLKIEGDECGAADDAAIAAMQRASDPNVWRALVLFLASDEREYYPYGRRGDETPALNAIAAIVGLDLDTPREKAIADRKVQLRNDIAELKSKAGPKSPSKPGKEQKAKKSSAPPAAQKKRAGKPSAEEVQAKIAEELQALDQAPDGAELTVAAEAAQEPIQAPGGADEEVGAAPAAPAAPLPEIGDEVEVIDSKYSQFEKRGTVVRPDRKDRLRVSFLGEDEAVLPASALRVLTKALWPFPTESRRTTASPALAPVQGAAATELKVGDRVRVRGSLAGLAVEHHGKQGTIKAAVDGGTLWVVNLAKPKKAAQLFELDAAVLEALV